jgi:hypothetical protein
MAISGIDALYVGHAIKTAGQKQIINPNRQKGSQ